MNKKEIIYPKGYIWLIEKRIVGFDYFTQLQPWYFLSEEKVFWVNEIWSSSIKDKLLVFGRRQDNDDLVCFRVQDNIATEVFLIHGWTNNGFEIIKKYPNIWSWLHDVLDDIHEWINIENN